MTKIEIDDVLYDKVLRLSQAAGYETPDEFVSHMLERELRPGRGEEMDQEILERLRELGYIS
jgi:Arc/MetJ family transcription regulator